MGRSTVWTSRLRRAAGEWERELFVDGMSVTEVRGALYDLTRTIDHLRISLAAVGQHAESWGEPGRSHDTLWTARQRLQAAVEKLKPVAEDLQAAFYQFERFSQTAREENLPEVRPALPMPREARAAS